MLYKWYKRVQRKTIVRHNGLPIFYIIYKPQVDGKNVITSIVHPDIKEDAILDQLLKCVADRVREFYKDRPELLEEILEVRNED